MPNDTLSWMAEGKRKDSFHSLSLKNIGPGNENEDFRYCDLFRETFFSWLIQTNQVLGHYLIITNVGSKKQPKDKIIRQVWIKPLLFSRLLPKQQIIILLGWLFPSLTEWALPPKRFREFSLCTAGQGCANDQTHWDRTMWP